MEVTLRAPLLSSWGSTGPHLSTNAVSSSIPGFRTTHGPGKPLARSCPILLEPQKVTPDSIQQTQAGKIPETN